MSNREAMLLEVIRVVRCHPDFDNGGPMAEMMDQALAGVEHPDALVAIVNLSRGLKPPPVASRPEAVAQLAPSKEHEERAAALFLAYVCYNYPPRTIISDPAWHAPKLFRAALRALKDGQLPPTMNSSGT